MGLFACLRAGDAGADRPSPHGGPVSVSSELWSYEVAGGSEP